MPSFFCPLQADHGNVFALQLGPNGVLQAVYPLAGNEASLGIDTLHRPRSR